MEWPNNTCFRLLKEYEMHPMLWDPKNPSYFNRDIKVDAWSEIASNMNKEISDVRAKLNSLLGSFRREKAKVNKSLEEGTPYISRWFAFNQMRFLLDKNKPDDIDLKDPKPEEIYLEDSHGSEEMANEELNENWRAKIKTESVVDFESINEADSCDGLASGDGHEFDVSNRTRPSPNPSRAKKRKKILDMEDRRFNEAFQILKESSENTKALNDECSIFCRYLDSKFRKYSHLARIQVVHAIQNVIYDADMGKYDYPPINTQSNAHVLAQNGPEQKSSSSVDNSATAYTVTDFTFTNTVEPR